ncbi:hypothetical protein AW736_15855 [Termitidicoccus mucosus]|uniref:DUF1015 domain-containing protein n=1 Tax=Termitidicoccus mucosus TaxID=1184151 RepID=A0A178IFC9_9BACT|nr:hypothetical protein AW736_15855 [Opitutaceae bacterium TSB47]
MRIRSFQGLRPSPAQAAQVACVPYDVINSQEAARLAEGNPLSLLHVIRPEIDLPAGIDLHSDPVYAKAVENFRAFQEKGILQREPGRCIYLYKLRMGAHEQTGVVAVFHTDDYNRDIIKKHEKPRRDKEDDRTRITHELSANPEPVFLTYRDSSEIDALADAAVKQAPLFDFTAPDGIQHTVWRVAGGADFEHAFAKIPVAYVADGHHRSASAARVGRERREANPAHTGEEDYNWFLATIFPASQLQVLPYNRLVLDLNGLASEAFLKKVRAVFTVTESASDKPAAPAHVNMYLGGKWFGLAWQTDPAADPVSQLDVSVLQEKLLAPVLGIDDPRTSKRIDFVGGIRGTGELVKRVDGGEAAVAFSMYPVTVDQLMAIADAGQIMPPKSTWFEPKLRSGLFVHTF